MTSYVVKANNAYKAAPQRDAVNEAMNSALNEDGSFDFDEIFINHPKEFVIIAGLAYYQITKDNFLICPPSINIKPAKKHEEMFSQFEKPIICTIKKALESGKHYNALFDLIVRRFYMNLGVFSDLPDSLKERAIATAKYVHGEDYDTTALENNEEYLSSIFDRENNVVGFNITKFEFKKY